MLNLQYFLGANSPGGFYSLYHELLPTEQAKAIYILKGGRVAANPPSCAGWPATPRLWG